MSFRSGTTLKISGNLKDTNGITVGTNHSQCDEPPDTIIKCTDCNIRPIKNCTSIYQMKLFTVSSDFIISRRPFSFIKWSISSDPIDHLLWNQCEVHLRDEDTDKSNGPQFIWSDFYWIIIHCKDIWNNYSFKFMWIIVPLEWREWWFDEILLQFPEYYNSILIT